MGGVKNGWYCTNLCIARFYGGCGNLLKDSEGTRGELRSKLAQCLLLNALGILTVIQLRVILDEVLDIYFGEKKKPFIKRASVLTVKQWSRCLVAVIFCAFVFSFCGCRLYQSIDIADWLNGYRKFITDFFYYVSQHEHFIINKVSFRVLNIK